MIYFLVISVYATIALLYFKYLEEVSKKTGVLPYGYYEKDAFFKYVYIYFCISWPVTTVILILEYFKMR